MLRSLPWKSDHSFLGTVTSDSLIIFGQFLSASSCFHCSFHVIISEQILRGALYVDVPMSVLSCRKAHTLTHSGHKFLLSPYAAVSNPSPKQCTHTHPHLYFLFLLSLFYFLSATLDMSDLNSPTGDRTYTPSVGRWSLTHWTTREVSHPHFSNSRAENGLPWWLSWWRICLQWGRPGFDPWVEKIPCRRERLPASVFWPGEVHGL